MQEEDRCRPDAGCDAERGQPSEAAADDPEQQHQPDAEHRHRDQLEPVVVEAPEVDERRQHQWPTPRISDRAEGGVGVEHREPVVGDDRAHVTVEDAPGLAEVEREVVTLRVSVTVQCGRQNGETGQRDGVSDTSGHDGS